MIFTMKYSKPIFITLLICFSFKAIALDDELLNINSTYKTSNEISQQYAVDEKFINEYSLTKDQIVYLNSMISRLKVTEKQNDQLLPIFLDIFQKRQSIMKKNGVDLKSRSSGERIGMMQLRSVKKDMDKLNKQTMKQLEKVLNKEQLNEYKKFQEEQRAEMRKRLRN